MSLPTTELPPRRLQRHRGTYLATGDIKVSPADEIAIAEQQASAGIEPYAFDRSPLDSDGSTPVTPRGPSPGMSAPTTPRKSPRKRKPTDLELVELESTAAGFTPVKQRGYLKSPRLKRILRNGPDTPPRIQGGGLVPVSSPRGKKPLKKPIKEVSVNPGWKKPYKSIRPRSPKAVTPQKVKAAEELLIKASGLPPLLTPPSLPLPPIAAQGRPPILSKSPAPGSPVLSSPQRKFAFQGPPPRKPRSPKQKAVPIGPAKKAPRFKRNPAYVPSPKKVVYKGRPVDATDYIAAGSVGIGQPSSVARAVKSGISNALFGGLLLSDNLRSIEKEHDKKRYRTTINTTASLSDPINKAAREIEREMTAAARVVIP